MPLAAGTGNPLAAKKHLEAYPPISGRANEPDGKQKSLSGSVCVGSVWEWQQEVGGGSARHIRSVQSPSGPR